MKKSIWVFSLAMLLFSTFAPSFTYALEPEEEEAIEFLANTLEQTMNSLNNNVSNVQSNNNQYELYWTNQIINVTSDDSCFYWELLENWTVKITRYQDYNNWCNSKNPTIPSTIWWYTVTSIWRNAFNYKYLTWVIIPDTVTEIDYGAFSRNKFSDDYILVLPKNLKTIWEQAFYHSQLSWIKFNENLESIWKSAFAVNNLSILEFPDNLKYIWETAFTQSIPYKNIIFWTWLLEIWNYSFQLNGYNIPETSFELIIPDSVTRIWMGAFQSNKEIVKVEIWSGKWNIAIESKAFDNCSITWFIINKETVEINKVWYWGTNYNPYEYIEINAKNIISNEGEKLFSSNKNWVYADFIINVPSESWTLDNNRWWQVYVKTLSFHPSIKKIDKWIFKYHYSNTLTIPWTISVIWSGVFENVWIRPFTLILNDWIEEIGTWAFKNNDYLIYLTLPNTLKRIKEKAFYNSYKTVWSIVFNEWLEEIGTWAFLQNWLQYIEFPESLEKIWENAFCNENYNTHEIIRKKVTWVIPKEIPEEWIMNSWNYCINFIRQYRVEFTWDFKWNPSIQKQKLFLNQKANKPNDLNKTWFEFKWRNKSNSESIFDFNTPITEDVVLYAKWQSLEEKAEEATTKNVVYTNDTTVTVWDETTEEVLSWSTTLTLVAEEVKQQEVTKKEDKTTVKEAEIKVTSDKKVEYEWWLEVYLEKTENAGTENETTGKVEWTIKFSAPIAVKIPVSSDVSNVKIQVKHWDEDFGFKGLTLNPVNECNNWEAVNDKYNWEDVEVKENNWERYATIYTCSASTFVAYTETQKPTVSQPSSGKWRPIKQTIVVTEEEHNSAATEEVLVEETSKNSKVNESVEQKVKKIEWKTLTRWEVAVMTNILLDVYPKLTENRSLNEVSEACENYADEQDFTKDEKKAITRLCKLSIMWIHNDNNEPLEEFLVKQKASNWEFAIVMDRVVSSYNEKDLSTIKEALKKLENDDEGVVFGTVYNVFMSIKNIFN